MRTANLFMDVPPVAPGTKATGKLTRVHEQATADVTPCTYLWLLAGCGVKVS
jgi:hypothetical protein